MYKVPFVIACTQEKQLQVTDVKDTIRTDGFRVRPVPSISRVTKDGIIYIRFSQKMIVPTNFDQIEKGTFVNSKLVKTPMVQVKIIPGNQPIENVQFTWNVRSFTADQM